MHAFDVSRVADDDIYVCVFVEYINGSDIPILVRIIMF